MKTHTLYTAAVLLLLGASALPLVGCEGRETLSVWQTKVRYAESIVRGSEVGTAWTITADSFDENEGVLLAVRLDDGYGKYYFAERAQIVVDPVKDTVALRLEKVTAAVAADEKTANASGVYQSPSIMTEPVRVPYNITP